VAAGAAAVVAAGALLCCWIAVEQVNQAIRLQATPVPAYALLRKAERWNPLSEQPHVTEAAIAANALDRGREARALHAALRKNPGDWYAYLMLGIVAGRQHKPGLAAAYLQRAHRLSPLDPVVIYAQENLHVGNPLKETEIAAIFMIRTRTLRGVAQR
jgi:cytochrome c-type biogenesis protein CcmH/NrfG